MAPLETSDRRSSQTFITLKAWRWIRQEISSLPTLITLESAKLHSTTADRFRQRYLLPRALFSQAQTHCPTYPPDMELSHHTRAPPVFRASRSSASVSAIIWFLKRACPQHHLY